MINFGFFDQQIGFKYNINPKSNQQVYFVTIDETAD